MHMPNFDPKRLSRKWSKLQKAKLKLFGGQDASQSWNWVASVSEIGDNVTWSERRKRQFVFIFLVSLEISDRTRMSRK
jgi:hypothetical protein